MFKVLREEQFFFQIFEQKKENMAKRIKRKLDKFYLDVEDVAKSKKTARNIGHNQMMEESSVRGGSLKSKKAYRRKEKHTKPVYAY